MNQMRYTLALDIGIASIGFAVLRNDSYGNPIRIIRLGVRIFEKAEQSDGSSLAMARRQARGARRVIRRRRHRKERIRQLIENSGLMSMEDMELLFSKGAFAQSVYELRVEALDRPLTVEEAVRLLIHFSQKRGYKSNSKSEEEKQKKESGKVKQALSENSSLFASKGYRTVGEMLINDERFQRKNADGSIVHTFHNESKNYKATFDRQMILDEIQLIFSSQRSMGAAWANEQFEEAYIQIWSSQRNYDEGPGGDSPYGGSLISDKIGFCTFEPEEKRAVKASYTAEYFRMLQTVNNLKLINERYNDQPLTDVQRKTVMKYILSSASANYSGIRKKLNLPDGVTFNLLSYGKKERDEAEKKSLGLMRFYHTLRVELNKIEKNAIMRLSIAQRDRIAEAITFYSSDDKRRKYLEDAGIDEKYFDAVLPLDAKGASHLSIKAMQKLTPYLEQGCRYDKACEEVYGSHDGHNKDRQRSNHLSVTMTDEIRNPVVLRAVSQATKVINAIVRTYGSPEFVRVELAREIGRTKKERDDIMKRQEDNAEYNEKLREKIRNIKRDEPTGLDIVKYKLYKEQNGVCLYSGANIQLERLFEVGYAEVDHIIPYSISFDDSYNNKVLVMTAENRQKGNRTPFQYMQSDPDKLERFRTLVQTQVKSAKKRKNLLTEAAYQHEDGFNDRNLVDTQYMSRVVYNLISDNLQFSESSVYKKRVQTINGAITAYVRGRLGLQKIRENGDLHHALDAVVIGCISPGMVQKISEYSKYREMARLPDGYRDYDTGEILSKEEYDKKYMGGFPEPWPMFRKELDARLSDNPRREIDLNGVMGYEPDEEVPPVFVSRMPRRKVTGAAHKETIRSAKASGKVVSKVDLTELKLTKDKNDIEGYYNQNDDLLLYNALLQRLRQFDGDAKAAFAEPFYKPRRDGTRGPLVKKVKIEEKATLTVPINHGAAANGEMVRVDLYFIPGDGYYAVPIYVSDMVKNTQPRRAVVAHKDYSEWKEMREEDYIFSLYKDDLVYIRFPKEKVLSRAKGGTGEQRIARKEGMFYYTGLSISSAAIGIETHDRGYGIESLGLKTLSLIEKYEVDVLGNYHRVKAHSEREDED